MFEKRIKLALFFACCFVFLFSLNTDATDRLPLSKSRSTASVEYSGISAILTIISDSGESESRYGMPCYGHTFLVLENTSDRTLDLCGREIKPGDNLTFGWWAVSSHGGVWFGIESNYIEAYGRYPDRVGLSREIDGDGIARLADYILTHDLYTPLENCAVRAVAAFNDAIPEVRELRCGYFVTPAQVVKAILEQGGTAETAHIDFTPSVPNCGFADEIEYYCFAVKKEK